MILEAVLFTLAAYILVPPFAFLVAKFATAGYLKARQRQARKNQNTDPLCHDQKEKRENEGR